MLSLIAAAMLFGPQIEVQHGLELPEPGGRPRRLMLYPAEQRLDPPKISPLNNWMFEWIVKGFAQIQPDNPALALRIRVYSQEHKTFDDPAPLVARMAMRLWELNHDRFLYDHSAQYGDQVVDFYLCYGGKAGGEQVFGVDTDSGKPRKVNTIYIYDLSSFSSPVEMAREVAHEYGHATLVPIGGYESPEPWANGYLGEKLFLRELRDEIAAKRLSPDDAMGADLSSLDRWVKANVDPLAVQASARDPFTGLKATGPSAMDAFLGLALYADSILPHDVFGSSLVIVGSSSALDYPRAVLTAVGFAKKVTLRTPKWLQGKPLWIPLGSTRLSGARVLAKDGGWAKVQPTGGQITLRM